MMFFSGMIMMFAIHFQDHHSYGNAEEVRPTHLSLDLTLHFDRKQIEGICELTLAYAPGQKATHVSLDTSGLTA